MKRVAGFPSQALALLPAFVLAVALRAHSQPVGETQPGLETQGRFAAALAAFVDALSGTYGDEGPRIVSGIDAMDAGLGRWNASIEAIERATVTRVQGEAAAAAGARLQLGAIYLERDRIEEALREFAEASRLDPRRADVHMLRGLAFDRAGRSEDAAAAFRLARESDPGDPVKAYMLVQHTPGIAESADARRAVETLLLFQQEHVRERDGRHSPFIRIALLDAPGDADPVFPPASYAEGFALLRRGMYEEAIDAFRTAAAGDPLLVDQALRSEPATSGIAALKRGQIGVAVEHLAAAVAGSPDSSEARRVLGRAYWFDQEYRRSAEQFEAAIRLNPRDERSRLALADVLAESGQLAAAERALQDAIESIPGSGRAHFRLGQLYRTLTRDVEALHELEQAAGLGPVAGIDRLHAIIGRLHLGRNNLDAAIEADRQWTRANPNDANAHRALGDAYRLQDRVAEALAEYVAVLLIDPRDAVAYTAIGQIHSAAGRYRDAVNALRRAIELKPGLREAWYAVAVALLRLEEADEGRQALETFQRLQQEAMEEERLAYDVNELKRDAVLQAQHGKYVEAAALWRKVVERQPAVTDNLVNLARALVKAGEQQHAIDVYARALALDGPLAVHRELVDAYAALGRVEESRKQQATYAQLKEERLRRLVAGR